MTIDIRDVELGYVDCALWCSLDDNDNPLDAMGVERITPETRARMLADVKAFVQQNEASLLSSGLRDDQIGHDFWLTRNGHGAGFWDRGLGVIGDKLTDACKAFPEVDLYVGDDGKIYQ